LVFTGTSQSVPFADQLLAGQVSKFADPNVAIAFMADLKDQFPSEQLSGEQALNVALGAADVSKFDPTAMLAQMQKAAIGAGVAGFSSFETGAVTGVLASRFGQETGTRVSGLFSKMAGDGNKRFAGMDAIESLGVLSNMSEEDLNEFTGSDRTMQGTISTALGALEQIRVIGIKLMKQRVAAGTEHSFTRKKLLTTFDSSTSEGKVASLERIRDIAKVVN
jgi:hypothetical protein